MHRKVICSFQHNGLLVLAVISFAAVACESVVAQPFYRLIDLGDLPGGTDLSRGLALSGNGRYVGGVTNGTFGSNTTGFGYVWDATTSSMSIVGHVPGSGGNTSVAGVNSMGMAVGAGLDQANRDQAFRWQNGVMTLLPRMTDYTWWNDAAGVNDSGQVAGTSSSFFSPRAVRWQADNSVENLSGDFAGRGYAINSSGHVVGYMNSGSGDRAMLWTSGGLDLGDLPGGTNFSQAYGISDAGHVVGMSAGTDGELAFLWTQPDGMISLGSIPGGLESRSNAFGVNIHGQVVGSSDEGPEDRAFLWHSSHGMLDLNNLLDSSGTGWFLYRADAINDDGFIVGTGLDPFGNQHGFLLIPTAVPEPSSLVLVGLANVAIASLIRRRRLSGSPHLTIAHEPAEN